MNSGISNYDINNQLDEFIDYIFLFYGADDAIYPLRKIDTDAKVNKNDILIAVHQYLATIRKRNSETYTWGDGDSLDRERVRDILLQDYDFYLVHLQHKKV